MTEVRVDGVRYVPEPGAKPRCETCGDRKTVWLFSDAEVEWDARKGNVWMRSPNHKTKRSQYISCPDCQRESA